MNSFVIFSFYTITRTVPSRECQKYELSKCNGCPIEYHFFCHKDFKTVFVFVLAQLEGPPQKIFGFNGNFNGKMTKKIKWPKITFPGSKMVPKVSKWGF